MSDPFTRATPQTGGYPLAPSSPADGHNPRKRSRTACTRCKNRKQKCDEQLPVCSNCLRTGADCDKADIATQPLPIAYTRALEDRVAQLEMLLAEKNTENNTACDGTRPAVGTHGPGHGLKSGVAPHRPAPSVPAALSPSSSEGGILRRNDALSEVVGIISLGNFEAPAYVGPSAGLSLAVNLGEMVQATVWKKAIPDMMDSGGPISPLLHHETTAAPLSRGSVRAMTKEEMVRYSIKEPPSEKLSKRLLHLYLTQLHPRYPFLQPAELWKLQRENATVAVATATHLSPAQRYGIFKLYMVFAMGATLLQLTNKDLKVAPERFYMTALQHMSAAREPRTVQNIEAMTLLVIYHLRSASGLGMWYMIGLAMRTCIDLGMHRKSYEQGLSATAIHARRRLFWTVYALERTIAISLGRPVSVPDRQIDVDLPHATLAAYVSVPAFATSTAGTPSPSKDQDQPPHQHNDNSTSPHLHKGTPLAAPTNPEDIRMAILLFQLRRIESRIHHSVYRTDKPLSILRPKLDSLYEALAVWRASLADTLAQPTTGAGQYDVAGDSAGSNSLDDNDGEGSGGIGYLLLHYHRAVRMLIQPFLTILPVTDPYFGFCLEAAGNICQSHKRLHQSLHYGHSFIAVQTIFVAGATLLFGLWTQTHRVWSVTLADDLRACSLVLFVMSERAPWVRKYRDAFELLVGATMGKLRSGEASLADMAAANQTRTCTHGGDHDSQRTRIARQAVRAQPQPQQQEQQQQQHQSQQQQHQSQQQQQQQQDAASLADAARASAAMAATFSSDTAPTMAYLSNEGDREEDGDMWYLVKELANWIDQDQGQDTPTVWMPDFETLQNMSSNAPR
ncbi:c6 transcription factor [Ophiostoma piceae UAMH 11346]|uniref:C6 transcription factor n=1 Tax=Ophiostoma piceae (strain UAMH 11346) TaxID=1262450 RepID=S3CC69_OPHP1|nr:c6 transcription factor [Ophiostoma piceae UAMH 11346]